eukprot:scaffold25_cov342-Pavlova_lutheri.AAC.8
MSTILLAWARFISNVVLHAVGRGSGQIPSLSCTRLLTSCGKVEQGGVESIFFDVHAFLASANGCAVCTGCYCEWSLLRLLRP